MLLPLWLFHWIFLSWWISCPVSKYQKVREKAEYLICSLASNFWPVTNIRKNLNLRICFCRWILEIWTWNLRGYISHVVAKKSLSIAPWRRNEERRGWAVFCHTESRKKSQRSQKAKRSSNQIKRVKENAWMLKLGEVC